MDKFLITNTEKNTTKSNYINHSVVNQIIETFDKKSVSNKNLLEKQGTKSEGEKGVKRKCSNSNEIANKRQFREELSDDEFEICPLTWRPIIAEDLKLKYAKIFSKKNADNIFQRLEKEISYFSDDLLKVRVFGKWHTIPRKQVSFGDHGLSYAFSGNCIPALPWDNCPIIKQLKTSVESVCQQSFNFVLVNRYKDGSDHMGEHRDDEKDLVSHAPIASLSFGQTRKFIFRHKDARGSKPGKRQIDPIKLQLEHGSLLLMEWPTNKFWYHQLPKCANAPNVRINLTFRDMVERKK